MLRYQRRLDRVKRSLIDDHVRQSVVHERITACCRFMLVLLRISSLLATAPLQKNRAVSKRGDLTQRSLFCHVQLTSDLQKVGATVLRANV